MHPSTVCTTLGLTATLLGAVAQSASAAALDIAPGTVITTLPYTDTGTTVGMVNDINSIPAGVGTYPQVAGPDGFYTFTILAGGVLNIRLTPTGNTGYDPSIYLLAGTPVGTSGVPGGGRDVGAANEVEQYSVNVTPGTYFLVVDSFYSTGAASSGGYLLELSGTAMIPEPGSAALAAAALGSVVWRRRRRGAR